MKKLYKALALVLVIAITAAVSVSITLAYLTDTDKEVNVMDMGDVSIQQLEYERVVDANGNWVSTGETDKYGYTPDKLQPFTQAKPLYPAVFNDGQIKWDDRNGSGAASGAGSHQQSWGQVGAPGSNQLFDDSVKNAQDKMVFVENTGKSDAYVRTIIAFEQGAIEADEIENVIMTNTDAAHWNWENVITDVQINDNTYFVMTATYTGPTSNPTGILEGGKISYPSLLQVYMKPEVTSEQNKALDGNGNGTYDILVLSQATQTEGFANAEAALATAFGEVNAANAAVWFGDMNAPALVDTDDGVQEALNAGKDVVLTDDVVADVATTAPYGNKYGFKQDGQTIDGGGNTIVFDCYGDDYGIMTHGGTIKNIALEDVARGVVLMSPTENVYLDNVVLKEKLLYPLNTTEAGNPKAELFANNSVFGGWTSFGNLAGATFTDCDFVYGNYYNSWPYDSLVKPYVTTTFADCTFAVDYYMDLSSLGAGCTITLDHCTVNGTVITADNCTALFGEVELPGDGRTVADCIIFK